jgi:hypothetical protein
MKLSGWMMGAAAIALAAACNKAPAPMTEAERTALADSVDRVVTETFTSLAREASGDKILSYYVRGGELVHAEFGMVYPTYDSLVKVLHALYRPGSTFAVTPDQKRFMVLDRDVVVFTTLFNGVFKDSAGKETPVHEAWTAVYHRTPDGWKIAADHESMAPPAPPAPPKPEHRTR